MGIGTARNSEKALQFCVYAGLLGNIPSRLTSISLFEAYREENLRAATTLPLQSSDQSARLMIEAIEGWIDGSWEPTTVDSLAQVQTVNDCQLILPSSFSETPAASRLCKINSAIRKKLSSVVTCTCDYICSQSFVQLPPTESPYKYCGWYLLKQMKEHFQAIILQQETGETGDSIYFL